MGSFDLQRYIAALFDNVERGPESMHAYQNSAVDFVIDHPFCALFIDLGMGKSCISLTAILRLIEQHGDVDQWLVVGPLRVVNETWPTEIGLWRHTAPLTFAHIRDEEVIESVNLAGQQERAAIRREVRERCRANALPDAPLHNYIVEELSIEDALASQEGKLRVEKARHQASRLAVRKHFRENPARIHLISREMIDWLIDSWQRDFPWKGIVIDESDCFVRGTPITTINGTVPIESVVIGDLVKTPYGYMPVVNVIHKSVSVLAKITLSDGRTIKCTPDHKFLTDAGWCKAEDLFGRLLYGQSDDETLQVRALWGNILDMEISSAVLRKVVHVKAQLANAARQNGDEYQGELYQSRSKNRRYEEGEYVVGGYKVETECCLQASQESVFAGSRGERNGDDEARVASEFGFEAGVEVQLPYTDREKGQRVSDELQGRLCMAGHESSRGSGRRQSQHASKEGAGQEERGAADGVRVVGVESIECDSIQDVYDLTVQGAPFYYANGVLVHNCLKDHTSNRFKAMRKVRPLLKRMIQLTATPAAETYLHLFPQIFLLDEGERFGRHVTKFQQRYFTQNRYTYKWELRPGAEEEIAAKIADIALTLKAEDYLALEKPVMLMEKITLSADAMALYRKMEEDFLITLPNGAEIEAETAAALSQKLGQMSSGVVYQTLLEAGTGGNFKRSRVVHLLHDDKIEKLATIVEEAQGDPLLVSYWHESSLARLKQAFPKAVVMDKKGTCIKPWNAGKIEILLIHPASAGHGLNLQHGGRRIVFFDIPWSLGLYLQLIGRLARQGQKRTVFVHHLIAAGTLDEEVIKVLSEKRDAQDLLFRLLKRMRARLTRSKLSR